VGQGDPCIELLFRGTHGVCGVQGSLGEPAGSLDLIHPQQHPRERCERVGSCLAGDLGRQQRDRVLECASGATWQRNPFK
jgi:hypothetical protein